MKTLIILGDGMADEPIAELGGKPRYNMLIHQQWICWLA